MALLAKLNIAIADSDRVAAAVLEAVFEGIEGVSRVVIFREVNHVREAFRTDDYNALLIDIFSLGVGEGIELIEDTRRNYSSIPICLIGEQYKLIKMPKVPKDWRNRFSHYYKLAKDQLPSELQKQAENTAYSLSSYLLARNARVRLRDLRNMLTHESDLSERLPKEKADEIKEIVAVAEEAIDARESAERSPIYIIPSLENEDIQSLIKDTLEESSKALNTAVKVNAGVLIFGALLVLASFIVASITQIWEAVAFGGFGLAGIIASLITNPLKSIGAGARRIVQLQAGYLGFLNQLSLLKPSDDMDDEALIARSRRLEEATKNILEALEKHFG